MKFRIYLIIFTVTVLFGLEVTFISPRQVLVARPLGTDISGVITVNTIWTVSGSPYNLTGNLQIAIGATLKIQPGVVVISNGARYIVVDGGVLEAVGTAEQPITLSSYHAYIENNPSANKWGGIDIRNGGTAILEHVDIRSVASTAIDLYTANASDVNSKVSLKHSTIRDSGSIALTSINNVSNLTLAENTFSNNTNSWIQVSGGILVSNTLLFANQGGMQGYELVNQSVTIPVNTKLSLQPGSVLFSNGARYIVVDGGVLEAVGTAEQPITLSSYHAYIENNPSANKWGGIDIRNGGTAILEHVDIRSVGSTAIDLYTANASDVNSKVSLKHSTIRDSGRAISGRGTQALILSSNSIISNSFGIQNSDPATSIDARNNWWGDPSGPRHPSRNPNGLGNAVSDGVLFDPWLTEPPADNTQPPLPSGDQLLKNPSFNEAADPRANNYWQDNQAGSCFLWTYPTGDPAGDPSEGSRFLVAHRNGGTACTSFYQDVSRDPLQGETYTFALDARASVNGVAREFDLVIWAIGGGCPEQHAQKRVVVTNNTWAMHMVQLTIDNSCHQSLRAEVYLASNDGTQTVNYNFDNVRLIGPKSTCTTLTVNVNPTDGGTANLSPAPDCPNDNSKYKSDTLITLTASANQGYNFASWSGDVTATENPTTITLGDQGRFVTANFNHKESEGPQLLANHSFESNVDVNAQGAGVWRWLGQNCFAQTYGPNDPAGPASEGQKFLVTHGQGTTECISFYQDIVSYPRNGDRYTFLIDARAPGNGVSREFSMVLRALSYDGRSVGSESKKVIVTQNTWSTYQVDLLVDGEYDFVRAEVYLESPENGQHINYNFDNARLHGPARMKISGKINFPNTEPISGVTLKLLSTNGSQLNATTTNETGTYSFGFIDYGEYRIQPELGKYTFKSGINCPSEPIFGTCQFGYRQKGTGSLDFSSLQNALNKPARVDLETRYLNEDQSVGIRANGIDQAIVWAYVYNDLGEPIPGVKLDMVFPGSDISKINTDGSGYTTDRDGIAFFNVSTTLDTTRLEFEILWNGQKLNGYRILVEPVTVEPEKLGGYLEKCVNSMKDVHLLFDLQTINEITKSYRTKLLPENILASQLGFALGTTNLIFEASSSSQELLTSSRMIFPGASYIEEKTLRNWQYPVNEDMIQYRVAYGGLLSALDLVPSLLESGSVYQDSLEDALTRSIESGTYFNNHSLKSFEFVVIGDVELGLKDYFTGNNSQDIREGSFDHIVQNNLAAQRFSNEYAEDLTARILAIQFLGNQYTPIQITLRNVKLIDEANEEDPDLLINRFLVSTIMLAGFDGPGYVMNAYNGYHGTLNDLRSFTKGAKMVALGSQAKVGLNDRLIMFGANCNSGISQILHQVKPKTVKADITSIEPIMQGHYIGKGNKKSFIVDEARLKVHVKTNMPANVMAYADYYPSFMNGLFLAEGGAFTDGDGIIEIDVQTGSNYTNGSAPRSGEDVIVTLIGSNETGSFFLGRTSVKWPVPPAEIRASGSTIGNEDIKIIEKPLQYYAVDSRSGISISFTLMNPFPYDVIAELRLPAALKNIIKDSPEVAGEVVKWLIPMKPNETVGMVIELTDYIKEIPAASLQMLTYQGESMLEWSTVPEMFEKYFPVKLKTIAPFVASANSRPDHKVELENISNNTVQSTVYVELYHANALIYSDSKMTILQPGESTEELFSLPADLANGQYLIVTKIEAEGREFRWPDQMTVGIYGIEADFGTLNSAGVAVGENITYSIHITNISQAQLSNVTVRSTVSDTTDLIQDGGAIANAQSLVWNVGNLGAGQNRDFQFVVRLSERSQDNLVVSSLQITSDQTVPLSKTITNFIKADNASPNFVYLPLITR